MTRTPWLVSAVVALLLVVPARTRGDEPKTFYDYLESSYVFGEVHLVKPMPYRDGSLLVYSANVTDLVHARIGKPRQLMLVEEIRSKDEKPPFEGGDSVVAPIDLLPQYTYWRDNLPLTPHHQIPGGRRYIFKSQADREEAKRVARPFAATLERKRADRWVDQADAVVTGLTSSIAVLREDSSRYLANHSVLLQRMAAPTVERLGTYLGSEAPEPDRLRIIEAVGTARATGVIGALEPLCGRDDATGAAAMRTVAVLGKPPTTAKLMELTGAKSEAVRAYAAEALGARAADEPEAFARASAILSSAEPVPVRAAAAVGLGKSRATKAIPPLRAAMESGDGVTRPAAAAIAAIGGEGAADVLKKTIADGEGEAAIAAVVAIVEIQGECPDCAEFLRAQHESNPDQGVRKMIGIMLELNRKHAH